MVTHAWQPAQHMPLLRLRVLMTATRLDAALATGTDPVASAERALRAGQLTSRRRRARFARSLRRVVASAEAPRIAVRGASVPVNRSAVLEAAPALHALADDLLEIAHPKPRGVALTIQLLSNGGGPLYRPWWPGELREAVDQARRAL